MKNLLCFGLVFGLLFSSFGAAIPGSIPIGGPVAPTDTTDTFPSHLALYGKGGWRVVADNTARDAIPSARREEGMIVVVQSPKKAFRLESNLTTWVEIPWISASDWAAVQAEVDGVQDANTTNSAAVSLARKLGNTAIPLTIESASGGVTPTFARASEAFHPGTGNVVGTNQLRAIPLAFGWARGLAAIVEPVATNQPFLLAAEPLLYPARVTGNTNLIHPGPYGIPIRVTGWTDTDVTNTHYFYYDVATNVAATPFLFSVHIKPNNPTNQNYYFRVSTSAQANFRDLNVNFASANPTISQAAGTPDIVANDYGVQQLDNGWWRVWVNATSSTNTPMRFACAITQFATYVGNTSIVSTYQGPITFVPTCETNTFPLYPLSNTNGIAIRSKPLDSYSFSLPAPIRGSSGTLILWLRGHLKQPLQSTLFETSDGSLRVDMSRTALTVIAKDTSGSKTNSGSVPTLGSLAERLVALTWTTNSLRTFVDGSLISTSAPPAVSWVFDRTGQIGAAAGLTNAWMGHIGAAIVPSALSDSEVAMLRHVVAAPNP